MSPETQTSARAETPDLPEAVRDAVDALEEHKAEDLVVLDMRKISGFTDFMVVCSGRNEPHVDALVKAVQERLQRRDRRPGHVEGQGEATWVLVDYYDFIVHVFLPESRRFYRLERLWRDAPVLYQHGEARPAPDQEPGQEAGPGAGPAGVTEGDARD
ncbi:MAG: ribosome silencing factor [Acidobacteriota bacterium]